MLSMYFLLSVPASHGTIDLSLKVKMRALSNGCSGKYNSIVIPNSRVKLAGEEVELSSNSPKELLPFIITLHFGNLLATDNGTFCGSSMKSVLRNIRNLCPS